MNKIHVITKHDPRKDTYLCDPPEPAEDLFPFPLDVLPKPVQDFVLSVAASIGCPVSWAATAALAAMSLAIGAWRRLEVQPGLLVNCTLFQALVGPSGSGKSPVLRLAFGPLYDLACKETRRAVITAATVESLALVLRERPEGVLYVLDELSALFESFGSYRSGRGADREFFLSAFSGTEI